MSRKPKQPVPKPIIVTEGDGRLVHTESGLLIDGRPLGPNEYVKVLKRADSLRLARGLRSAPPGSVQKVIAGDSSIEAGQQVAVDQNGHVTAWRSGMRPLGVALKNARPGEPVELTIDAGTAQYRLPREVTVPARSFLPQPAGMERFAEAAAQAMNEAVRKASGAKSRSLAERLAQDRAVRPNNEDLYRRTLGLPPLGKGPPAPPAASPGPLIPPAPAIDRIITLEDDEP